jgi:hypothetical protein
MVGVFVLLPVVGVTFSLAWWVPLVIFATVAPSVLVQLRFERRARVGCGAVACRHGATDAASWTGAHVA